MEGEGRRERAGRERVCSTCTVFWETDALMVKKMRLQTGVLSSSASYIVRAYGSVRWSRLACARRSELEVRCRGAV